MITCKMISDHYLLTSNVMLRREMEEYGCPPNFPAEVEGAAPPKEEDDEPVIKVGISGRC